MNCEICDTERLNKRSVTYAKKYFRAIENKNGKGFRITELIPVCSDCAQRVDAELIDAVRLA